MSNERSAFEASIARLAFAPSTPLLETRDIRYSTTGSEAWTPTPDDTGSGTTKAEAKADDSKAAAFVKPRMVATSGVVGRLD